MEFKSMHSASYWNSKVDEQNISDNYFKNKEREFGLSILI